MGMAWAAGSPVQLKIERRGGLLAATYLDKSLPPPYDPEGTTVIPLADLYDFGGGFYFTLLLGHQGHSMLGGPATWVPDTLAGGRGRNSGRRAQWHDCILSLCPWFSNDTSPSGAARQEA